jgi:PAS domain S-box-containing protein
MARRAGSGRDIVHAGSQRRVRQILGTAQDNTAPKLAEEQATYQANLLQNVSDAIISTDIQFRIQSWNPAAERIYGWKAEEVLGKPLIEIVPTDFVDDRWNQESPARYLLENGSWTGEVLHGRRDGSVVHMYSSTTLIKDSAGRMVGVVSINHDTSEQEQAEEARRKSEEQYRTLARNLPNGVVALFDTDLRYTLVEGAGMLGAHLSKESVEGKTVAEVFDGEERLEIEARYRNALAGIESITEMVYQDRVFQNYTLPVRNEHGEVFAGMSMSQDITERKRAEDALRLSEARYRAVIEEQNELVCRSLPDGRLSFVNDAYCRYFGKTREALIGANSLDLVYDEDREVMLQQAKSLTLENPEATYEHRALAGSGIRWQQWNDRAIFDAEGNLVEYQSVGRDITEKKQAEEALRQSEARFRQMAENIHEVFYLIDPENRRVIYLNPAFDSTWGQPRQPFLDGTLKVRDTLHPEDAARFGPLYDEQYEKGTVVEAEYRVLRPDGSLCWIWDRSSPIRDSAGKFYRLVGTAEDITKRKLAEQARREVEERLLTIVNNAPVVIFALDRQANLTLFEGNPPGGPQLDRNTLIGRPIDEIYAGSPQFIENCRRALAGEAFTATVDTSTGRVFETYYAPLRDSDGTIIGAMGVATDITERRQAEEALRTSELRFRSLTETVPVGIGIIQGAGFVYVNPALQAIGGYSPEELLKTDFWERVHPDRQEIVKERGFARMRGESAPTRYEDKLIARQGEERWVDTSVGLTEYDGKPAILITVVDITERKRAEEALAKSESRSRSLLDALPDLMLEISADGRFLDYKVPDGMAMYVPPDQFLGHLAHDVFPPALVEQLLLNIQRALETGQVQTYEYQLAMAGSILDFEARVAAIPNENRLVLIARDITARRRSERELLTLNADLERRVGERTAEIIAANERLTELDYLKSKFISDVSHELRTPVMNLSMYLYLMEHDRAEKRARHLAVLKDQVIRLRALLENVLDLSRLDVRKGQNIFAAVDLNSIVEQVVFAHRPRTEVSGLALYCELAAGLPPVHGERNQLAQVVTNLLANAINYTPAGEIRISTTHDTARGHACLTVTDTGMGIAEEDLPHLFERFYRGRQASQSGIPGTGLGLGIVQEIVTLHGGQVEVESEIGRGSVFRVWLPLEGHQGADKADKDAGNGARP